jgi:hypothetical protein
MLTRKKEKRKEKKKEAAKREKSSNVKSIHENKANKSIVPLLCPSHYMLQNKRICYALNTATLTLLCPSNMLLPYLHKQTLFRHISCKAYSLNQHNTKSNKYINLKSSVLILTVPE